MLLPRLLRQAEGEESEFQASTRTEVGAEPQSSELETTCLLLWWLESVMFGIRFIYFTYYMSFCDNSIEKIKLALFSSILFGFTFDPPSAAV